MILISVIKNVCFTDAFKSSQRKSIRKSVGESSGRLPSFYASHKQQESLLHMEQPCRYYVDMRSNIFVKIANSQRRWSNVDVIASKSINPIAKFCHIICPVCSGNGQTFRWSPAIAGKNGSTTLPLLPAAIEVFVPYLASFLKACPGTWAKNQ